MAPEVIENILTVLYILKINNDTISKKSKFLTSKASAKHTQQEVPDFESNKYYLPSSIHEFYRKYLQRVLEKANNACRPAAATR